MLEGISVSTIPSDNILLTHIELVLVDANVWREIIGYGIGHNSSVQLCFDFYIRSTAESKPLNASQ